MSHTHTEPAVRHVEVVVVGGGAAGLSGALTLARARRSVLVIDAGEPRNAPADQVHGYLGREGTPPAELLAIGRSEVAGYGGEVVTGTVTRIERTSGGTEAGADETGAGRFRVTCGDGTVVVADRMLVTTGLVDELPPIPGLAERWGRDLLHCPYCHGWEVQDRAIGVIGTGPMAVHQALLWRQWSKDVVLFAHTMPAPTEEQSAQLAARDVAVVDGEVTGVVVVDDRLRGVAVGDDRVVPRDALVTATRLTARAGILADLGLATTDHAVADHVIGTAVAADATGATAAPGVWVAGNVANPLDQVIAAAASGVRAAAAINADLVAEEARRAAEGAPLPHR